MEFDLPVEIIQHIQSFLDGGEAARTCLLSKSWYYAWSTRPILVFKFKGDNGFYLDGEVPDSVMSFYTEFCNNVGKTMKRYKQFNLKLEKLVFCEYYVPHYYDCFSIDELIADASAMGITDLDLNIVLSHDLLLKVLAIKSLTKLSVNVSKSIDGLDGLDGKVLCSSLVSLRLQGLDHRGVINILLGCPLIETLDLEYSTTWSSTHSTAVWNNNDIVLCPRLVSLTFDLRLYHSGNVPDGLILNILFRSPFLENLDCDLNNKDCIIPLEVFSMKSLTRLSTSWCRIQIKDQTVICSNLLFLRFFKVVIGDDDIPEILLGCPLLENLEMEKCTGMSYINVSKAHNVLVALRIEDCCYENQYGSSATLRSPKVFFGSTNAPEFHKLRSVLLSKVIVDNEFFSNLQSRFPRLNNFTLDYCTGYGSSIHISSQSLENIQLCHDKELQEVEFDVPNIRKFVFETCDHFPSMSFSTTSMEWESKVKVSCSLSVVKSDWFVKLREFLKTLSLSRISLNIDFKNKQIIWAKDLPWSSISVVENLTINNGTSRPVAHDHMCALFRCCRPTFISIRCLDSDGYRFTTLLHDLFLVNQNNANCAKCLNEKPSLLMYDLEEIDLEMLEGKGWQSIPLSKFVEDVDPVSECEKKDIRFRLKWGAFRSCTS